MTVNTPLHRSNYNHQRVIFPSLSSVFLSNRWVLLPLRRAGRCTVQLRTLKVDVFVRWLLLSRRSVPEMPEQNSSDSCWRRYEILLLIIIRLVIILLMDGTAENMLMPLILVILDNMMFISKVYMVVAVAVL